MFCVCLWKETILTHQTMNGYKSFCPSTNQSNDSPKMILELANTSKAQVLSLYIDLKHFFYNVYLKDLKANSYLH